MFPLGVWKRTRLKTKKVTSFQKRQPLKTKKAPFLTKKPQSLPTPLPAKPLTKKNPNSISKKPPSLTRKPPISYEPPHFFYQPPPQTPHFLPNPPPIPYPPLPHKHGENQENNNQTGSQCVDKAGLARDARYQKNICSPKTCPYLSLSTLVITGH